jgi:hypothetical protein
VFFQVLYFSIIFNFIEIVVITCRIVLLNFKDPAISFAQKTLDQSETNSVGGLLFPVPALPEAPPQVNYIIIISCIKNHCQSNDYYETKKYKVPLKYSR